MDIEEKAFTVDELKLAASIWPERMTTAIMVMRARATVPDNYPYCDSYEAEQLFLKYILAEPAVTCVIPATGSPTHMKEDLAAGFGQLPDARQRHRIRALWDAG